MGKRLIQINFRRKIHIGSVSYSLIGSERNSFWQFQGNLYHQLFSIVAVFVISEELALQFVYLWRKD